MNVCLVCAVSSYGSMGDNFLKICKLIREKILDKSSFKLYLIGSDVYKNDLLSITDKGSVFILSMNKYKFATFLNIYEYFKLFKFINENKINFLFFYSIHPINIFIIFCFLKEILMSKIKIVFWWHDPVPHSGTTIFWEIILKLQYMIITKFSSKIIVSYDSIKLFLQKNSRKFRNKQIYKVELGILDALCYEKIANYSDLYEYDLIFWGRIQKYKGIDILIDSLLELCKKRKIKALIVGKGKLKKRSLKKIYKLQNNGNVIFINDYIKNEELAWYIKKSRIAVFPYLDATGSQVLQVAYYYGKPVICTKVGCFPEYTNYGRAAILIPPNDPIKLSNAICNLLEDNMMQNKLIKEGKRLIETKFDDKRIAKKLISIIVGGGNENDYCF